MAQKTKDIYLRSRALLMY